MEARASGRAQRRACGCGGLTGMQHAAIAIALAALAVLVAPGRATPATPAAASAADVQQAQNDVVAAANAFSVRLYQAATADGGNLVISPVSAAVLLALTRHGARGATEQQLTRALQLSPDLQATAAGYQALLEALQTTGKAILRSANMLFTEKNFRLNDAFRRVATGSYKAGAGELDFRSNPEGSRYVINQWTEQYTEGRIKELFDRGIITEETVLVLANAIYFKAGWFKPFEIEDTRMQPFYVNEKSLINVPTMFGVFQMYYGEIPALDAIAVKLEYNEDNMDMTILVPNTPYGLPRLEAGLGQLNLADVAPEYAEVHLSLPKFKIESNHRLKGKLEQLGIVDVFTLAADLSNMAAPGLYVSDIVQKTFIGVDEKGTEAAVATGQNFFLRTSFGRKIIKVDRPFLFVIHHKNTILFMGRVVQPTS